MTYIIVDAIQKITYIRGFNGMDNGQLTIEIDGINN